MGRRNSETEEFFQRPGMVGQSGSHGWSALNPVVFPRRDPEPETQAVVIVTKVVETTDDIHVCRQCGNLLGWTAVTPGKRMETLAEGGVEALNVGGVDDLPALRRTLDQSRDLFRRPLNHSAHDLKLLCRPILDHLNDGAIRSGDQSRATGCTVSG